jgi:hypothetical protein
MASKNDSEKQLLISKPQRRTSASESEDQKNDPKQREVSVWEIICCPCIFIAACFAMFIAALFACGMTILYWGGCMPKVKISHIEK